MTQVHLKEPLLIGLLTHRTRELLPTKRVSAGHRCLNACTCGRNYLMHMDLQKYFLRKYMNICVWIRAQILFSNKGRKYFGNLRL